MSIPEATVTMDYQMLLTEGKEEYQDTIKELSERFERMSPYNIMQKQAELTDNMSKIMSQKPLKMITV